MAENDNPPENGIPAKNDDDSRVMPEPVEGVSEKSSGDPENYRNAVKAETAFNPAEADSDDFDVGLDFRAETEDEGAENQVGAEDVGAESAESAVTKSDGLNNGTFVDSGNWTNGFRVDGSTEKGPDTKFAYATWFIVLMCIIVILIIILIIVCLIKRSRGGRYPVQKKEQEAGYDAERDGEAGLGDFTRTEDDQDLLHRSGGGSQGSLNGSLKPLESDADSLAAYGDGEGGKFNEDGSFIGQYGPDKKRSNTGTDVDLGERINGNVQIISNNNGAVTTFV